MLYHQALNKFYVAINATNAITYLNLFFHERKLLIVWCGLNCTLSPSSEQILCCNKCYQCNSTYLNSFFLESKLLSFLQSNYALLFPLQMCFFSLPIFVPFTSVFFSSLYVHKHMCIVHVLQHVPSIILIKCVEFLFL